MMSESTTYFAPGAATWWIGQNIRVVFDFRLFAPLREKWRLHKTVSIRKVSNYRQDRAIATENVVKFGRHVATIRQTDIQTC